MACNVVLVINKVHKNKLSKAEVRTLRWSYGKTRKDRLRNEYIRENIGVA